MFYFLHCGTFQRAICPKSGEIENHLLQFNALLRRLAFAICLRGKVAIPLKDIRVSLQYKCCLLVPVVYALKWTEAYLSKSQYGLWF